MAYLQFDGAPPVFSFVVNDLLAAHGLPTTENHMKFLRNQGIKYVVTLMEELPEAIQKYKCPETVSVLVKIRDYTPPSINQIIEFVRLVERARAEGTKVSAHCIRGMGRTGTMLACFLVKAFNMKASEAIQEIRRLRPGSIETREQEEIVATYDRMFTHPPRPFCVGPPPAFSYVVNDLLAGHGLPTEESHMKFLEKERIKYIITLMPKVPDAIRKYKDPNTKSLVFQIPDFQPPDLNQIRDFVALVENAKAERARVSVHCIRGMGRTGTMLACFLVKAFNMKASEAIQEIRRLRPGSIETREQEDVIEKYALYLANT